MEFPDSIVKKTHLLKCPELEDINPFIWNRFPKLVRRENADTTISTIAFRTPPSGKILHMIFREAFGAIEQTKLTKPRTPGSVSQKKQDLVIALGT